MRKLIDIPEDIYKNLQHICIDEGTNPKNWIEQLVNNTVFDHPSYRGVDYEVKKKSKQREQT